VNFAAYSVHVPWMTDALSIKKSRVKCWQAPCW